MSEPTDPLAELREIVEAGAQPDSPYPNPSEKGRRAFTQAARTAIRYLTSPEAEVEIARVVDPLAWSFADMPVNDDQHVRHELTRASRATARAVLRFIAEKAVTR